MSAWFLSQLWPLCADVAQVDIYLWSESPTALMHWVAAVWVTVKRALLIWWAGHSILPQGGLHILYKVGFHQSYKPADSLGQPGLCLDPLLSHNKTNWSVC
jgi:hypothetical protein